MTAEGASEKKWWQDGLTAGVFGVIASLGAAGITYLHDSQQRERDLQVQQQQELAHLRTTYAAVLAEGGVEQVALLADFIASTEQDPMIRDWAAKQRDVAQKQVADLKKQLADAQAAAAQAESAQLKAQSDAALALQAAQRAQTESAASQAAQAHLADAQKKLAEASVKADQTRQAVEASSTKLGGASVRVSRPLTDSSRNLTLASPMRFEQLAVER